MTTSGSMNRFVTHFYWLSSDVQQMIQKAETEVLNLSNLAVKRALMEKIRGLNGIHEVLIKPRRYVRTLSQNNYYFVGVCQPFRDWLREQYGDPQITIEQAHEMLKVKILGLDQKLVEDTGEVLMLIPRSKTLDTFEFGQYIDKCAAWLAEFCGIVVLPPEMYYEVEQPKRTLTQDLEDSIAIVKEAKRKKTA